MLNGAEATAAGLQKCAPAGNLVATASEDAATATLASVAGDDDGPRR